MGLKRKLTKAEFEKLDAAIQALYNAAGDGYSLDVEDGDGDALKRAKDREKEGRKTAETDLVRVRPERDH